MRTGAQAELQADELRPEEARERVQATPGVRRDVQVRERRRAVEAPQKLHAAGEDAERRERKLGPERGGVDRVVRDRQVFDRPVRLDKVEQLDRAGEGGGERREVGEGLVEQRALGAGEREGGIVDVQR